MAITDKWTVDPSTDEDHNSVDKYSLSIEELDKQVTQEMEEEYSLSFDRQASYLGNFTYSIAGLYSSDTRQLFLMYCLLREDLKMDDFARKMSNIKYNKTKNKIK